MVDNTFFQTITFFYTGALILLIFGLETLYVNSRLLVDEIPSLNKKLPQFKIYGTVFRRILITFFLNLIVNLFLVLILITIFNSSPNNLYEEYKTEFVITFIIFNLIGLWAITKLYEKTSFGKSITDFLNSLINSSIVEQCSTKILKGFSYFSVFIKSLPKLVFKEEKQQESSKESIQSYNQTTVTLSIPNYFDTTQHVPNSKEELEKMVVLLDSIVLALTAVGLLLTSSFFSSEVSSSNQYLFVVLFISVIITKITANHERVRAKSESNSFEDAS